MACYCEQVTRWEHFVNAVAIGVCLIVRSIPRKSSQQSAQAAYDLGDLAQIKYH